MEPDLLFRQFCPNQCCFGWWDFVNITYVAASLCFLYTEFFSIPKILDSFQSTQWVSSNEHCANLDLSSWPSKLRHCTSSKYLYRYTLSNAMASMHNLQIFVKYNSFGNSDSERGELHIFTVLPMHRNRKQP